MEDDSPLSSGTASDPDQYGAAVDGTRRTGWSAPAPRAALLGGVFALISTVLLPLHLGGHAGTLVGVGFVLAALSLAGASMALGAHSLLPHRARQLRSWSLLGAMGFLVSGIGLIADLLDWPIVLSEVIAILAVGAWWCVVGGYLLLQVDRKPGAGMLADPRLLGYLSLACAVLALATVLAQFLWEAPTGAVPARLAYLLWGPWGLVLAMRLARAVEPV